MIKMIGSWHLLRLHGKMMPYRLNNRTPCRPPAVTLCAPEGKAGPPKLVWLPASAAQPVTSSRKNSLIGGAARPRASGSTAASQALGRSGSNAWRDLDDEVGIEGGGDPARAVGWLTPAGVRQLTLLNHRPLSSSSVPSPPRAQALRHGRLLRATGSRCPEPGIRRSLVAA